ncbi:DUF4153 domain-containing protein [Phaeovulum sp. W22_SRMD_FR3]|uniref:DUF4153 domain-containing protein n=1 Tax=Phaeovulum sp. W22_SRMD_FR3 TaxID=3240274 RepID=UPI003F9C103D
MLRARIEHAVLGTLAGAAGWSLTNWVPDLLAGGDLAARLALVISVLALSFFTAALVMLSQVGLWRALGASALLALLVAALAAVASLRFDSVGDFLDSGHHFMALFVLMTLPVPFLMGWGQGQGWRAYPALFVNAWSIVVRYAAAWLFTGVVWGVLWLSALMLNLVGIKLLEQALMNEGVAWLLTGAALGLALAVVAEMSDLISPYLVLRLFRLLLPVVLVVITVFVLALPLRGLNGLFGHISAASMLLSAALGAISLISIAVDQRDSDAAQGRIMRLSAQALALLVPVLAALAVWAVGLRVAQYGWTPERVSAMALSGITLGYGLGYGVSVIMGSGWMRRIRAVNLGLAWAVLALAALWLTVISPEKIAVNSQLARFDAGRLPADALPLWEMAHDWGRAGAEGLAQLRARAATAGQPALAERLKVLESSTDSWTFNQRRWDEDSARRAAALVAAVPVLPADAPADADFFTALGETVGADILDACARRTPQDHPGCLLVLADLLPGQNQGSALLFTWDGRADAGAGIRTLIKSGGSWSLDWATPRVAGETIAAETGTNLSDLPGAALIDQLWAEGVRLVPTGDQALAIGSQRIVIKP